MGWIVKPIDTSLQSGGEIVDQDLREDVILGFDLSISSALYRDIIIDSCGKEWKARVFSRSEESLEAAVQGVKNSFNVYAMNRSFVAVEGIGNISRGLLNRPLLSEINFYIGSYYSTNLRFKRQTDLEGNLIFSPYPNSGVNETASEGNEPGTNNSYDLSGKRVEAPESGSIYIKNGKKYISH